MCGAELNPLMAIKAVVPMPWHAFNAHSGAHMLRAQADWLDPFIGVDSYTVSGPTFGPHPHAGMSAVSVMLPESEGSFRNRDTMGDNSLIHPGDLHWFQAGRGAIHEEEPIEAGIPVKGLQVFVNLRRANKQSEPVAFKVRSAEIPLIEVEGGSVRLVAGRFGEHASPLTSDVRWLTQVNILDISLAPHATLDLRVARGDTAFFVIRSGSYSTSDRANIEHSAVIFEALTETDGPVAFARVQAGSQALRGVFFSGTPMNEPVIAGGPFVGNSVHDIRAWREAYAQGRMGQLSASQPTFL